MIKTDLSKYNNTNYKTGQSAIIRLIWYFVNILFFINPLNPFSFVKVFILRVFGAKVGKGVNIKPSVNIKYPWKLQIADYVWIGENVWIDNLDDVIIGDNVCLSQGAMILCGNHNYKLSSFDLITSKIILEDGVWIGAKAIVCTGVTCSSHSILAAGSVANVNLDEYAIYQGNPAVKIRERKISE